jgi:hypothetical protein
MQSKPATSWLLTVAATVVLFLLTRSPFMASILPYLRAGWPAFRSALWLRRCDPLPSRGKTCFWFYLATAGWKAGAAALVTLVTLAVLQEKFGQATDMTKVVRTLMVMFGGILASVLFGVIGIVAALVRRVRVFVIPNIYCLCGGEFPMIAAVGGKRLRFNHAIFIVATSLVLPTIVAGTGLLMALGFSNPNHLPVLLGLLGFGLMMIGPIAMIPLYGYCSSRIIARSPGECWAPDVSPASR